MTLASEISTREAKPVPETDLVLGDDWVTPHSDEDAGARPRRRGRGIISIKGSPLARKIITFNLLALLILVAGVLWLNPTRDNLVVQREAGLVAEAHLIADVFEAQLPATAPVNLITGDGVDVVSTSSAGCGALANNPDKDSQTEFRKSVITVLRPSPCRSGTTAILARDWPTVVATKAPDLS